MSVELCFPPRWPLSVPGYENMNFSGSKIVYGISEYEETGWVLSSELLVCWEKENFGHSTRKTKMWEVSEQEYHLHAKEWMPDHRKPGMDESRSFPQEFIVLHSLGSHPSSLGLYDTHWWWLSFQICVLVTVLRKEHGETFLIYALPPLASASSVRPKRCTIEFCI